MIQLEGTLGVPQPQKSSTKRQDLPNIQTERVNLTLLPKPKANSLKREGKSSPTKLVVGVVYYQIQKNIGGGFTQMHVITRFGLKTKSVALCLIGKKYFGGKDKKVAIKHKTTETMVMEKKKR